MSWQTVVDVVSTGCLVLFALTCLVHVNAHVNRYSSHRKRLGFAMVIGGAIGQALSYWWPKIELFPLDVILHIGLALVALAVVRGDAHSILVRLRGWDGVDRRGDRPESGRRFDGTLGGGV